MAVSSFLADFDELELPRPQVAGLDNQKLILGRGHQALEVAVYCARHRPSMPTLRSAWKDRKDGRTTPVVAVVLYDGRASLCSAIGDKPIGFNDLATERAEQLCRIALAEPDRHAALRFLRSRLPIIESPLPALINDGLFATYFLEKRVRQRADWTEAIAHAQPALTRQGQPLLEALGFTVEPMAGPASILRRAGSRTAIAVLLDRNEPPEVSSVRFSNQSPVSYALNKADEENLPWVIVCAGPMLRLYPVKTGVGVAQRGRTETFTELRLDLMEKDAAGYLWLIFSAEALHDSGSVDQLLEGSKEYAADLGKQLRERIYEEVIPPLAERLMAARGLRKPTATDLADTYQMTLTLLFRLLFVAYAEDKNLLPYRANEAYRERSLKHKAQYLRDVVLKDGVAAVEAGTPFDPGFMHWEDVVRIFDAVDNGNTEWSVPKYNGGLFSNDPNVSKSGGLLAKVKLNNQAFAPILTKLLLERSRDSEAALPVDFASLGVREFGTIYEGLLENELSIAETDLTMGKSDDYKPAGKKDEIAVRAGRPYLHNKSGARKASGSYFTKSFAVEHLLDHALEPALDDHFKRLDGLPDDRARADAFFDFRVADIAMGSGHFLVAAIDRIERAFSRYLSGHPLPDVTAELLRLRNAARAALGPLADAVEIEDNQLLRRQIARRCIYGVDMNQIAVELARMSVWIHTFVPGLPLSFLDHNLIKGNSLVGIATIDEAREWLKEVAGSLFALSAEGLVGAARSALDKLGRISDAVPKDIADARAALADAEQAVAPAEALFDILAAARLDEKIRGVTAREASQWVKAPGKLVEAPIRKRARKVLEAIPPTHFPIAFPEVFLRERAGFDVILGNPPWEKAKVEEHVFWNRFEPGFWSLPGPQREASKRRLFRDRPDLVAIYEKEIAEAELLSRVLVEGPFPGMGTGDPDVYKAFARRFWDLASATEGRIGVVLPRTALAAKGSAQLRKDILENGAFADLTFLLNRGGWVFDDAEHRYTIALTSICKGAATDRAGVPLCGPFASFEKYNEGRLRSRLIIRTEELRSWNDSAALPLLPGERSGEVFLQLRKAPRLDSDDGTSWLTRPYAELHATNDKKLLKLTESQPDGFWPVYQGRSFDIWVNDTGTYYAWAEPDRVKAVLQKKRLNSARSADSPFRGFAAQFLRDEKTLGCNHARIAFRDIARATDTRTVRAALVPPRAFLVHLSPFLIWPRGDEQDEAFLLGIMCSIPLDWYARRFVEIHLTYDVLKPLPIPRPKRSDSKWQRTVALAGRLACPDKRFKKWAEAVGVEYGPLKDDVKQEMIHELDAVVAHLYGLSEAQLIHIFETFHEKWDYSARLIATLAHFHNWGNRN